MTPEEYENIINAQAEQIERQNAMINELQADWSQRGQFTATAEALQKLINLWNDAAEDGDRGRANDMLVLTIWDDGSGRIGTATGYREAGTMCTIDLNVQDGYNEAGGLVDILVEWLA